ncbi:MAX gene-associated protein isoform X1 [Malaclemys terrapin pileata]|uniref:MAX gene-associated protein isoform X1 n=1 Tax=Malaclemys terrapin pileata TaxID=2991368 RepID=UPI0023A8F9B0|nr:MAX gene-associated protein isoform X1 [Malaclemys terrapin pileata]XP_053882954.1 MAX gene-associated protein isoform X1 [Malaclemys terrapin pileata]XP_053882955.1 MAX gene-associated protein isoform X1 [Malaclemys terrapin pileata]
MEKQQIVLGNRDSGTVSGAAPAFFVILKQQQGNGKADQGILVANRDACTLTSSVSTPVKSKVKTCLPADCTSGSITVTLDNNSMWNEFYHRSTEMILTKQGRRMFPYCRYWITGLDSNLKYILVMDISPVDNHRYKWNGRWWEPSGKAEPHVLGRVFIHPESPSTGQYWMHQPVSFYKLKLTNNTLDQEGHIILHSMHRYLPRLHLVPADKATEVIQLNGPDVHTFTFPQTEFFAVTAYQNIQITQLKIDYNPFAKGFRDDGLNSRPPRDVKQNSSSEHEGGSVSSSPSNRGRHTETDGLESQQRDLDSSFSGQNPSDIDLEKESFNAERDFLDFLDADLPLSDMPRLKQEVSESPIASSYESSSRVASPLDPNGHFNVVIKEEPIDDYDYGSSVCMEGITVKQEDTDEETDEYSNSDDDPILEKQLRKHSEIDRKDAGIRSTKRMLANPSGVAKAKMLKLDSGKMPVVYLEPCAVTKSTVKISELPQTMLSSCKKDKSPVSAILDSFPICFENHKDSCLDTVMETEEVAVKKQFSGNKAPQKYCSIKEAPWTMSKSSSFKLGSSTGGPFSAKDVAGRKKAGVLRNPMSQKGTGTNQNPMSSGPSRRGRPRKLKISKAGRPPKNIGKNVVASKNASLGLGSILPDVKPDLEDVDGVLFVSFASKEALDIHTVDRVGGEESQNLQTSLLATSDPGCRARIRLLEKELLEDLKSLRHKQVIHPSLQEVGLKLNSVDPTMSIDLKYLGVQLPLSYSKNYSLWNYPRVIPSCSDAGFPFVSRTGKTNDFTKIKGWRGKFHGASRNEGSGSEGSLKNRSAFCSDKLDEYLENEGKLMETSMGFSSSTSASPVVYQLPTKSTSYVRTLDSVLKKQSTSTPSTSYTFKPLSVSSASRKMKTQNKQTASKSRVKPSYKPILPSPVVLKQKHSFSVPGEKITKSLPSSNMANQVDNFMVPALDENMLPKQINLRQAHQQQQATRPPGLSKSQVKLMDLEDCALWDGKPRTYITEERADISLATLLTAQASLKNKPIHKIIRRRAPPCNNDFCRLGCICASLALEKRQPTHCRRPDCMFGCTCLKRRVLLVKGGSKHKKILKKAVRGSLIFYGPQGEDQQEEEELEEEGDGEEDELKQKDRRRRKKVEYTICDTEPEQPIRNCPLWIKVEGEIDPEPIYIPTPSVIEPMKPLVLPTPEDLPSSKNKSSNGVKPGRVYTPKPNPVIRDEDKDPVYLYFERMMTCARVRAYECKREEKKQQKDPYICNSNNCTGKEHDPEHQTLKKELCEMEKDTDKSGEESWWSSRSEGESSSASYVRHTTPGGPAKLIEIISDCNWEEDRNKILSILSQHINSNMPQSLKVGNFIIELASEHKSRDEKNPPIYSSRVKISMPSCQDKGEKPEMPVLEIPDSSVSSCKISENIKFLRADTLDKLRETLQGEKGLPFYTGLSPAGKLVAYKRKANLSPSGLIQVNGKSYPQAKLLLGLMGALHPANRLAAYITGRLRPTVLDLSTLSTVISKVASNAKAAASGTPSVQVPTTSTPQTTSSISTTSTPTVTTLKAHVPAQRQIAARPSPGGVFTQFVMSKVGALQQKIPGVSTPQPLTGPQKFNVRPTPIMVVTPMVPSRPSPVYCTVSPPVTATTTTSPVALESVTTSSAVTTTGHTRANESTHSPPGIAITGASGTSETSACTTVSPTTPTATVNVTKATGMTTPVATISFPKSVVTTPTINHPVPTTTSSPVVVTTTAVTSMVTTPPSSVGSVPIILSGINTSPSLNPRPEDGSSQTTTASPQGLSSGTEKRGGPRLLLIPVHQGSPALRPLHNVQLAQGHRMILQPLRSPGGVNLFRHPNGQIIQLVPLHQLRAAGTQSNIQPVMFRNPGSVVGIRLPGPSKPPETPVSPMSSTSVTSVSPAKNPAVQTVGSKFAPTANLVTQASSILPSAPSFVSQAGTLTLRISPPGASSIAGQTGSESKIMCNSGGQPTNAASLIPLQSGSFALLQLPGQKSVPNSILHHVASLQIKKDSQSVSQKDESSPTKQQAPEKASHSEDVEVMESEVTVSDSKQEENELPSDQSNSTDKSAADVILSDRNFTASEMTEKDPEMLEDYTDDIPSFQHDVSADVISSDHSYISEKPISEKNKVITEKKEDSVHSEEVLEEVSDNSGTISELLGQAVVAPANTAYPESPREQEETALLKSHVEEYTSTVEAESPDTEQEGNAQPQKKGEEKVNAAQSQSPQEKQEISAQLESKDKQQEGTQPLQNQKELQESIARPEVKRKECEDSVEAENIMEERENKSGIIYTKEHGNNSGEMHVENTDECKRNLDIQEKLNAPNQEQGTTGFQKESDNAKDNSSHVNSSWSTISSKTTDLDNKSNTERENKVEKSVKGYFLTPEQRSQEPKHHKKGYTPTVDITIDDVEEEEEEDDEKTDDSADEMLDGASDFQSEEEVDVEKLPRVSHSSVPDGLCLLSEDTIGGSALLNDGEYSENDEPVDIETVEELSEKINIARLKATASSIGSSKQKHRIHNPSDEKVADKSTKKPQFWNRKQKNEAEAFAHYRQTHTANERRRRNEMRDLFEKLKRALGLHSLPKVSKCYILKQAYEEIQGLTDQADKLIGQKNLLTRKQDILIRKVSTLSGKTEEVVLKKLEYIYAKQKAVEAQKKRKQVEPEELVVSTKPSRQQEESSTSSKELGQMIVTNRRGKPLILARKGGQAAVETTSSPITLTTASLVMTPQGQVLTLKSPLMPGQVAAVPSTLLQAELKPQVASNIVTTQPGIASVMIQLPGSTVPVQVKGILTNSAIPITLSTIASNPVPPAVGTAAEPPLESEDSFMMPKIVNVTSLAAEGGVNLNLNRNKNSHVTPGAGAQTSEPSLKAGPHESRRNEDILSEEKNKASPGDSCGDGRNATGPTQIFLENKDNSFPQIRNVPSVKDSSESFAKKSCIGEFLGSQGRRKETDQGGERLKPKDSPFRKLQVKDLKDSRIEMELRKVASAMEEAELDPSELLGSIEESDDTDETLTSLLNEIAFLNQQLNDDTSGMSELPGTLSSDFSPQDSETQRGTASDLTTADGASFQFGHLGSSFKGLSEVRESSGSISPLLLHLEDDDLTDGERNSAEPSSQADILKIVIGSEMKDPIANLSVTDGGGGKTVDSLVETNVSPPILQMKTNLEAGNTDTLWRPMPKLAPLGLKIANLPLDSEGQSTKVMPVLAPVVAKLAPVGLKTKLPSTELEGQDSKVMPTLASVVAKLNSIGTLPSNSAGK